MLLAPVPPRPLPSTPPPSAGPIQWDPRASRGGQHLPTDRTVEVAAFNRSLTLGSSYRFQGGIAQSIAGIEVLVEHGGPLPAAVVLARIGAQLATLPTAMTSRLRQIIVYRGQDEGYDKHWERAYNIPGFQAVAAGGGGQVTFFGGKPYTDGVLFHELGHNLVVSSADWKRATAEDDKRIADIARGGRLEAIEFEPVADAARRERWTPRLAPGGITPYGHGRPSEDICESMRMLLSERHYGHAFARIHSADGSVRDLTFAEAYASRTAVLERATGVDLDGDGSIGS